MKPIAKTIVQILAAGLSAVAVALTGDGGFSTVELINIAIAIVGAIGVYYVPNADGGPLAKSVVSGLMAVLTLAVNLIADGITMSEWLQLAVAAAGAIGVYGVTNRPSSPAHVA